MKSCTRLEGLCRHLWAGCGCILFAVEDRQVIDGGQLLPVVPCARWGLVPSDAPVLCSAVPCSAVLCSAVPRGRDSEPWVRDRVP